MKVNASTQTPTTEEPITTQPKQTGVRTTSASQHSVESASPSLAGLSSKKKRSGSLPESNSLREPKVVMPKHFGSPVVFQAMRLPPTRDQGVMTKVHDIHNHSIGPGYAPNQIFDISKKLSENLAAQIKIFDDAGVDQFLWSPIPTIIKDGRAVLSDSCGADHGHDHSIDGEDSHNHQPTPLSTGKSYYMHNDYRDGTPMTVAIYDQTAKAEQYYNTSVDWQVGKAYNELPASLKSRCYPAVTGNNQGDANAVIQTLRLKKEFPDTFYFFGEETVYKEFVSDQNLDYKPDLGPTAAINDHYVLAARAGMPKLLHCDSSNARNCIENNAPGKGEYRKEIEDFLGRHKNTDITFAHLAGCGKYGEPPEDHEQWMDSLLKSNPHVKIDMSWDVVAEYYSPNPQKPTIHDPSNGTNYDLAVDLEKRQSRIARLADVINRHPDQFIMGSDALVSRKPESLTRAYGLYSNFGQGAGTLGRTALFDRIHPDTLVKVKSGNFEAMVEKALKKGKAYESGQLQKDLDYLQTQAIIGGRTPNNWPPLQD